MLILQSARRNFGLVWIYRGVEQLVARRAHNPKVAGSSPAPATGKLGSYRNVTAFFYFHTKLSRALIRRLADAGSSPRYKKVRQLQNVTAFFIFIQK